MNTSVKKSSSERSLLHCSVVLYAKDLRKSRTIVNRPLAGTVRRGKTEEEDKWLEQQLLNDEKQCAEHIMLVDLGRNDVGRVSKAGSVKVEKLMNVERYSHVMHISSTVTGEALADLTCWDALRAALPVGTVSGAPKLRITVLDLLPDVIRSSDPTFWLPDHTYIGSALSTSLQVAAINEQKLRSLQFSTLICHDSSVVPVSSALLNTYASLAASVLWLADIDLLNHPRYTSSLEDLKSADDIIEATVESEVKAMELIDQMEATRRGPYSGGFGGVSFTGDMDIAIALRTIVFPTGSRYNTMFSYKDMQRRQEWVAHLQAGAGIVADSNPDEEQKECENKAAGLARAIDLAESTFV
ncbi:hypothetical protein ZIOFF_011077 [Zingiber officinale]|uniref:Chorismate-utilising enzyme C-terminal domain-containing protein n=1 Tax=Zingiber officinale TaxID=94328 RepID=A0A8J5HPZ2_ZINOF|nr:hypothetical protein ZIOFF_011077 [Zingiber officinale]